MWGHIFVESTYQTNFNVGFSNTKSDILIHLAQWQYWWWYWFTYLWCLYFFLIIRVLRLRTMKFHPIIVTSFRPHGKWGDLLVCLIPASWCLNILINSSFLLKLIEWQNESSLFTFRIRGRQWYWVYKFDLKGITDILSAPKLLGSRKWFISINGSLTHADDHLHLIQLRAAHAWLRKYWGTSTKLQLREYSEHFSSPLEKTRNMRLNTILEGTNRFERPVEELELHYLAWLENNDGLKTNLPSAQNVINWLDLEFEYKPAIFFNFYKDHASSVNQMNLSILADYSENDVSNEVLKNLYIKQAYFFNDRVCYSWLQNFSKNVIPTLNWSYSRTKRYVMYRWDSFYFKDSVEFLKKSKASTFYNSDKIGFYQTFRFPTMIEGLRFVKRSFGVTNPLRILKNDINNFNDDTNFLFKTRFSNQPNKLIHKNITYAPYLVIKQKRYTLKKRILEKNFKIYDEKNNSTTVKSNFFLKNHVGGDTIDSATKIYKFLKKNKKRDEMFSVVTCRRLLRTRHTLVLPAHANVTAITNSYDIIHSWFIPGLGLKIDCVPGRATHHTFYADNAGFYYGQCAEICGRYHHHMPIRLCVLPYEQFLVWWQHFGLPKLLFSGNNKYLMNQIYYRKYIW